MKFNCLVKVVLCLLPVLAFQQVASGQTMLSDLKAKKSLWRAIVDKKINGVEGWNAGFPTERAVDKNKPDTFGTGGDTLMYAAMLCASGERAACSVIPDSLESSGQLRRNPLLRDQPNGSKYGRLSKDHSMATLYWLSLPNDVVPLETKRNFALNWQRSFDQQVTEAAQCDIENTKFCLAGGTDSIDQMIENSGHDLSDYVPGQNLSLNGNIKLPKLSTENLKNAVSNLPRAGQETLDKLRDKAKNSKWYGILETTINALTQDAQTMQACLSSVKGVETCIKESLKGGEAYVKAILAATAMCTESAIQGVGQPLNEQEIGRCVVNMSAAVLALPRVCEDINCVMSPTQMAYTNKVWERLGLNPPFVSPIFDSLGFDSEEMALSSSSFGNMNKAHLAALNILVRRNLGMKTSRLAGRLTNKQPNNPMFLAISKNPVFTRESIAGLLIEQCKSIESIRDGVPQYLAPLTERFNHTSFWRWKTPEQDEFTVDSNNFSERISMVWDCIYVANLLEVKEFPYLSATPNLGITIKVKKNDNPTVYDTLARGVSAGVPPLRYELVTKPSEYAYFSFEAESGNFIFRPINSYFGGSFKFAVIDAIGRRVESFATIAFDHSEIYPGHPPLTKLPETPLPANINPLFRITHAESGQVREMTDSSEPAETLVVSSGTLQIEAEAFIENVDETYDGVMDCTLDWTSKDGAPSLIKDNDEYPKNFYIQQTIQAQSLEPYVMSLVRMTCMAPDMPIIVRDIPLLYTPEAGPLKMPLDQGEYTYASNSGATLKMILSRNASDDFNRVYNYTLNTLECGQQNGTLVSANNANKLTINGSFDGYLINGDPQKLVWLNTPVCGKTSAIVWKLLTASSGGSTNSGTISNSCNLQAYPKKDGTSLAKPASFDADMNKCGKAVQASAWSCSWVSADKTWIIPSLKAVVFAADRWGSSKYNIFSYETVKRNGCTAPEGILEPQANTCDLISKGYKATDSTGNLKPSSFATDMSQCASKVKAADWGCRWVSADETWIIPSLKSVIFTAERWGTNKYNAFSFDTVRKNGCKNPDSLMSR